MVGTRLLIFIVSLKESSVWRIFLEFQTVGLIVSSSLISVLVYLLKITPDTFQKVYSCNLVLV